MISLETMQLGRTSFDISRLGMGCWAIGGHGWGQVRDEDSIRAINYALDHGVTFFDTADVYGLGKSETILARVLGSSLKKVTLASKGGVRWNEQGKVWPDISPAYMKMAVENSLRRLKLECIPLYYIHKTDHVTPVQESVAALEEMRVQGKIGAIGLSNFSVDQIQLALQVAPITAIQLRLNIFDRNASEGLLDICREHGMILVAWGALADGLLTGKFNAGTQFSTDDHRSRMQEFSKENFMKYEKCISELHKRAVNKGRKVGQLALRWVLDLEPFTCCLFGAKTEAQVKENLGAYGWSLTLKDYIEIDQILIETGII